MVCLTNLKAAIFLAARVDGNESAEHVGKQTAIFVPVAEKEEEESGNYALRIPALETHRWLGLNILFVWWGGVPDTPGHAKRN